MDWFYYLDVNTLFYIQDFLRTSGLTFFFEEITDLGNSGLIWILLGLAMLAYIIWGDRLDGFKRDVNRATDGIFSGCRRGAEPSPDLFERIEVEVRPLADVPDLIRREEISHSLMVNAFAFLGITARP